MAKTMFDKIWDAHEVYEKSDLVLHVRRPGPEALEMMRACFTQPSEGLEWAVRTHDTAADSYRAFVEPVGWLDRANREMSMMRANSRARYLARNVRALAAFNPA